MSEVTGTSICFIQTIGEQELLALELVSYIGCGVSLACLLVTVIFFLSLRYVSGTISIITMNTVTC